MLYHPDVWLRLEALKLGCKLLEDADLNLQAAFRKLLGQAKSNSPWPVQLGSSCRNCSMSADSISFVVDLEYSIPADAGFGVQAYRHLF